MDALHAGGQGTHAVLAETPVEQPHHRLDLVLGLGRDGAEVGRPEAQVLAAPDAAALDGHGYQAFPVLGVYRIPAVGEAAGPDGHADVLALGHLGGELRALAGNQRVRIENAGLVLLVVELGHSPQRRVSVVVVLDRVRGAVVEHDPPGFRVLVAVPGGHRNGQSPQVGHPAADAVHAQALFGLRIDPHHFRRGRHDVVDGGELRRADRLVQVPADTELQRGILPEDDRVVDHQLPRESIEETVLVGPVLGHERQRQCRGLLDVGTVLLDQVIEGQNVSGFLQRRSLEGLDDEHVRQVARRQPHGLLVAAPPAIPHVLYAQRVLDVLRDGIVRIVVPLPVSESPGYFDDPSAVGRRFFSRGRRRKLGCHQHRDADDQCSEQETVTHVLLLGNPDAPFETR